MKELLISHTKVSETGCTIPKKVWNSSTVCWRDYRSVSLSKYDHLHLNAVILNKKTLKFIVKSFKYDAGQSFYQFYERP